MDMVHDGTHPMHERIGLKRFSISDLHNNTLSAIAGALYVLRNDRLQRGGFATRVFGIEELFPSRCRQPASGSLPDTPGSNVTVPAFR